MRRIALLILSCELAPGCVSFADKGTGPPQPGSGGASRSASAPGGFSSGTGGASRSSSASGGESGGIHSGTGTGGAAQSFSAGGSSHTSAGVGNTAFSGGVTRSGAGGTTGFTTRVTSDGPKYWSALHTGKFWIGPVDYEETKFHNACAPSVKYPAGIQRLYGKNIIGLANEMTLGALTASEGQLCDVCAELSANGQTLIAHVVTFGQETGPTDMDVSLEVDSQLQGSVSRDLSWRFVSCPTTVPIRYTFDGRLWSNTWFFRVWVRNARVPIAKLEYRIGADSWMPATWQSDGAFQASGSDFGTGFSLRVTSIDGQNIEDTVPGLNTFDPDVGVSSHGNFE